MAPNKKGKGKALAEEPSTEAPIAAILENIPEPIAVVDLSDIENPPQRYNECVDRIIKEMKDGSSPNFTFLGADGKECACVPVTPGPDKSTSGVYTIALKHGDTQLTLVAQKYQNWFRGIVTNDGDMYELTEMEPKIMAGSKSLHNTGRYYDLLGKTVDQCMVGFNPLIQSFYNMARHNERNKNYGVSIAVLLVMFFEAPRFPEVLKKCMELLEQVGEAKVGEDLQELINNWATISLQFFKANGDEKIIQLSDQTGGGDKEGCISG